MDWLGAIASKGNWPMLFTYRKSGKFLLSFVPRQTSDPKDRVWCDTLGQAMTRVRKEIGRIERKVRAIKKLEKRK